MVTELGQQMAPVDPRFQNPPSDTLANAPTNAG